MKRHAYLEPGLLNTYRLLSWVLLGISVLQALSLYMRTDLAAMAIHPLWIFPLGNVIILGLLYWPEAIRKTGSFFVPLVVTLATVGSVGRVYLTALLRFNPEVSISILVEGAQSLTIPIEVYEFSLALASWQIIPLLFIPLIMVAWQYNFKAVVGFIAASTLLDLAVFLALTKGSDGLISVMSMMGVLGARILTFLVVGFLVSRMMSAQRDQQHQLKQANQQLLGYAMTLEQLTTTRERNRLARELHDTLAHTLSGLAVQLVAVRSLWETDPNAAHHRLGEAIDATRSGLNETRRALQALRASPLEDLGLCLAIDEMAQAAAERCGATLSMDIAELPVELPPDTSQAFYRAAQEALENVVRHSQARHITLKLGFQAGTLTLEVSDDGTGFDFHLANTATYGLRGLQERARLINGHCQVSSQAGRGTNILFSAEVGAS